MSLTFLIIIGALISGALAWFIGKLINPEGNRTVQFVVFIVAMGIFNSTIIPKLNHGYRQKQLETTLEEIPFIRSLKTQEPELYQEYLSAFQQFSQKNISQENLTLMLRNKTEKIFAQRLATASDEAILGFIKTLPPTIAEVRQHSGEMCYQFLFPQSSPVPLNISRYISQKTQKMTLTAMENVILQQENITAPPTDVKPHLQTIMKKLYQVYGDDLPALANPLASNVPKKRICDMFYDYYKELQKLDPKVAASIMRASSSN